MNFSEMLAPETEDEFIERNIHQNNFHLITGSKNKFTPLIDWKFINSMILSTAAQTDRFRVFMDGGRIDPSNYLKSRGAHGSRGQRLPECDEQKLYELLENGVTLVVDQIDKISPEIEQLVKSIEYRLSCHCGSNLYVSWPGDPGFNVHWDKHDVFALQIIGKKDWKVYGATKVSPVAGDPMQPDKPTGEPIWEGMLSAGDMLFFPRGVWHVAEATNDISVHLTIGATNPTGISLMKWAADELRKSETFRKDIPWNGNGSQLEVHEEEIRAQVAEFFSPGILLQYKEYMDGMSTNRSFVNLPNGALDRNLTDVQFILSPPRPLKINKTKEQINIAVAGKRLKFPKAYDGIWEHINGGNSFSIKSLSLIHKDISQENIEKLMKQLIKMNIVKEI